jgi:hypothetical protein
MSSRSLDPVITKIYNSNSNQNLYRSFSREDRIALQSTPLSNNSTGSAKGLVSDFTPRQFQSFDVGRDTYATIAQEQDCTYHCMTECTLKNVSESKCYALCKEKCKIDTRKDFI